MADNPIVNRTSAIRDAVDDDTPQESSESGKAYIAKMTAAYDRLAEVSGSPKLLGPTSLAETEAISFPAMTNTWLGDQKKSKNRTRRLR